jgi:type IV pilus assembly protein PilE
VKTRKMPESSRRGSVHSTGFTLIEVVIVIVIVGILMAVALPGYQESMNKGRRADAKAGLMDAVNRQERFMLDRSTYTEDMTQLGFGADPMVTEEGHYTVEVEDPDVACPIATCYVLTATPVAGGAQADDAKCTSFTVDSTGAKTATGSAAAECW